MKECLICNKEFEPYLGRKDLKYCNPKCLREANRRKMKTPEAYAKKNAKRNKYENYLNLQKKCGICKTEYIGKHDSKYCSPKCSNLKKNLSKKVIPTEKECIVCNSIFTHGRNDKRICSLECKKAHTKEYKKKFNKNVITNCKICGEEFTVYGSQVYCNETCSGIAYKVEQKKWRADNWEHLSKEKKAYAKANRDKIIKRRKEAYALKHPIEDKECKECDTVFTPSRSAKHIVFCSYPCRKSYWIREEAIQKYGKYSPKGNASCIICEKTFMQKAWNQKTCSKDCNLIMREGYERKYKPYSSYSPMQKINARMRAQLRQHLKWRSIKKTSKTYTLLGYTGEELYKHIESHFTDESGYSWDNMSEWHIDHIRPVASFNHTTTECEDFKKCWALNNLQPMWASDNLSKSNKWDGVVNA